MINVEEKTETKLFRTLVKKDHKFGGNDYVLGRISGYKNILCDGDRDGISKPGFGMFSTEIGTIMACKCTLEEYNKFIDLVNKHYPGLCVFDYNNN